MPFAQFLIKPQDLILGWEGEAMPLGIIDLDAAGCDLESIQLPPFPLIGIGCSTHRLARQLDVLVEPPFSLATLVDQIRATPHSAAIIVQVLRTIEGLPVQSALAHESLAYGLLQGSAEHATWLEKPRGGPQKSQPAGKVRLDRLDDTLNILLDRPAAQNAIDSGMRDRLREAFHIAAIDPDIRVVRLEGAGRAFCVGADLAEFGTTRDPATAHLIRMQSLPALIIAQCAEKFETHVQGACVGSGLEMAAFARHITAGPQAWFHLPELAMGIMPGAGGCVSVSRRIGRQRAALMILSAKRISAQTALSWGLVDAIIDH